MPRAKVNTSKYGDIELEYQTHGDPQHECIMLIMGLSAQMPIWRPDFIQLLVDQNYFVVRFDNRDVGFSTKITAFENPNMLYQFFKHMVLGWPVDHAYTLADMAQDVQGLMDVLNIRAAHVVGASMGGMIAQELCIHSPERVLSLTSIMSTTGDPYLPQASWDLRMVMLKPPQPTRELQIEQSLNFIKACSSPKHFDEAETRPVITECYDRCSYRGGVTRQLLAIVAAPNRTEPLKNVKVPALIIHGEIDPLVPLEHGKATHSAIPGSTFLPIPEMGHEMPRRCWGMMVEGIIANARRAQQQQAPINTTAEAPLHTTAEAPVIPTAEAAL